MKPKIFYWNGLRLPRGNWAKIQNSSLVATDWQGPLKYVVCQKEPQTGFSVSHSTPCHTAWVNHCREVPCSSLPYYHPPIHYNLPWTIRIIQNVPLLQLYQPIQTGQFGKLIYMNQTDMGTMSRKFLMKNNLSFVSMFLFLWILFGSF